MKVQKKNIVVTGSGRGIGFEMCKQALEAGHSVWAWARTVTPELEELAGNFGEMLHIVRCDVTQDTSVATAAQETKAEAIDLLINNAGAYLDSGKNFKTVDFDAVAENFAINAISPMRVTRALLPKLEKAGAPVVTNITSLMGSVEDNTSGGSYAYRMSKSALNMFTKCFSCDFKKITSIAMHPGWVQTRMGGKEAPTTPQESAAGILEVSLNATSKANGSFVDFEGDTIPW